MISAYAPQSGWPESEKFRENVECFVQRNEQEEKIVIGVDMNAHVGDCMGFEDVHGGNGYIARNEEECWRLWKV